MKGYELSGGYDTKRVFTEFGFNYYTDVQSCPTAKRCVNYTLQSDYLANQIPPKFTASVTGGMRFFDEKLTVGGRYNYVGARARLPADQLAMWTVTPHSPSIRRPRCPRQRESRHCPRCRR